MHASAVNFALGFFGWPLDGKYEQVITIEASGVSFTFPLHRQGPRFLISHFLRR